MPWDVYKSNERLPSAPTGRIFNVINTVSISYKKNFLKHPSLSSTHFKTNFVAYIYVLRYLRSIFNNVHIYLRGQ